MLPTVRRGTEVYARDGRYLGTVSEVKPELFKLDTPMRLDYWLPRECVASETQGTIVLCFPYGELDSHRVEPGTF